MGAGVDAIRAHGLGAGRAAVLAQALDPALAGELREVVDELGGRVIVRSSSPLEGDGRWAGAFSSVTGVGRDDVETAVRSCWASAFAVDPVRRAEACGLGLEALELAVLVQPEIAPEAGGVARVRAGEVTVDGVLGHPGALLAGWAEAGPVDAGVTADVAELAGRVYAELGDDAIEWAACEGQVWLLQSLRFDNPGSEPRALDQGTPPLAEDHGLAPVAVRQGVPGLAADIMRRGAHVPGRPGAPGMAVGRLVACRPHERPPGGCNDAVLLVDRPVPALAPLLFGARGVIARSGAAGSHLAGVARSLGVPMVIGCHLEPVTGPPPVPGDRWLTAINGSTGDVALLPAGQGG